RTPLAVDARGEGRVIHVTIQQQDRRSQAVAIFNQESDRPSWKARTVRGADKVPAVGADIADVARRTAAQRVLQKLPRPDTRIACLPHLIAFETGDGAHALPLARAAFDHALQGFQGVN